MKRNILIAGGILAVVALSSTVTYAATQLLPWTNNIYSVSDSETADATVSVFDDAGNKCYVVHSGGGTYMNGVAISCLKEDQR